MWMTAKRVLGYLGIAGGLLTASCADDARTQLGTEGFLGPTIAQTGGVGIGNPPEADDEGDAGAKDGRDAAKGAKLDMGAPADEPPALPLDAAPGGDTAGPDTQVVNPGSMLENP